VSDRKAYAVIVGGVSHTFLLDDAAAKRYGAAAVEVKAAPAPQNKAHAPQNKAGGK